MKIYKITFCCLILLSFFLFLPVPLIAVDGYKSLKFGITSEEVRKSNICTLIDYNKDVIQGIEDIKAFYCLDFKFNGKTTEVFIYFVDNIFLRLIINIPYKDTYTILNSLKKKYGKPSPRNSKKAVDNFYTLPNQEINTDFDKNTIQIRLKSDGLYKKTALLIYTSPLYLKLVDEKQGKAIMDDL